MVESLIRQWRFLVAQLQYATYTLNLFLTVYLTCSLSDFTVLLFFRILDMFVFFSVNTYTIVRPSSEIMHDEKIRKRLAHEAPEPSPTILPHPDSQLALAQSASHLGR